MNPDKPRCKALTKSGQPCGAAPTPTGLCFFHGDPNKASVLGRIGGKRNRRPKGENAHPVLKLNGAASASQRLELLYHEVETGSIRPTVVRSRPVLRLQGLWPPLGIRSQRHIPRKQPKWSALAQFRYRDSRRALSGGKRAAIVVAGLAAS